MTIVLEKDINAPKYNSNNCQRDMTVLEFTRAIQLFNDLLNDKNLKDIATLQIEDRKARAEVVEYILRHINGTCEIDVDTVCFNNVCFTYEGDDNVSIRVILNVNTGELYRNIDVYIKGFDYAWEDIDLDSKITLN